MQVAVADFGRTDLREPDVVLFGAAAYPVPVAWRISPAPFRQSQADLRVLENIDVLRRDRTGYFVEQTILWNRAAASSIKSTCCPSQRGPMSV